MDIVKLLKSWVLVNWKTSALGLIGAVEVYQQTHNLQLALTAFFAGLFASDGKLAHAALAPTSSSSGGYAILSTTFVLVGVSLAVVLAVLGNGLAAFVVLAFTVLLSLILLRLSRRTAFLGLLLLVFAGGARAQDVTPSTSKLGGGCFATAPLGDVCFAPDVAIAVVAFRDSAPELGFSPGAGYKAEVFANRWYTLGAGAYIAISTGASSGSATFLGSFAHYIRAGVARDLYSANKAWYPVLGLGMDFGPSR